ncbi:MAG: NAD-dependent epimerase/dehydratase family protein [Acidobacteriota bacterium]
MAGEFDVVTGAFGYSGRYVAARLLERGHRVRTLTNSISRQNSFGGRIEAHPFNFDDKQRLVASLAGAAVLYNTYWVRFDHRDFTHSMAVENTLKLFDAARTAGVTRVVHVSITNPSEDSHLPYFKGKAVLEKALINSGIPYAILRPAVLFGAEDILINNIAWMLRRFPVFGVFGDGTYRLQPIYVDDLAELAVEQGANRDSRIIDAIGPERFTYRELVSSIAEIIRVRRWIISVPPPVGYMVGWICGKILRDVVVTREEIEGLMLDLLYTSSPPAGRTKLTDWARRHADTIGRSYASELRRRRDRLSAYA